MKMTKFFECKMSKYNVNARWIKEHKAQIKSVISERRIPNGRHCLYCNRPLYFNRYFCELPENENGGSYYKGSDLSCWQRYLSEFGETGSIHAGVNKFDRMQKSRPKKPLDICVDCEYNNYCKIKYPEEVKNLEIICRKTKPNLFFCQT